MKTISLFPYSVTNGKVKKWESGIEKRPIITKETDILDNRTCPFERTFACFIRQKRKKMIDIQNKNGNSKLFLLTLLGMLTAFGPFVTDMYLPSLPSMGEYFRTTPSLVQLGLTASMIGLAAGQIFFGPLSDKYGRRPPLLAAMYLFIISTIGCIFAPTIAALATRGCSRRLIR